MTFKKKKNMYICINVVRKKTVCLLFMSLRYYFKFVFLIRPITHMSFSQAIRVCLGSFFLILFSMLFLFLLLYILTSVSYLQFIYAGTKINPL